MLVSMLSVAAVAIVLFALPLAVAVGRLYKDREVTRLEREAIRAVAAVPNSGLNGALAAIPPNAPSGISLAYYDTHARLVAGHGPETGGRDVEIALQGREGANSSGTLRVAVPILDEATVVGAAQAAESIDRVHDRTYATWFGMVGVGAVALAGAALLARRQARRLAIPVNDIETLAVRLGEGDFTARIDPHDVPELARAAEALNETATRLGDLVGRERAFTADVSHQLRTPLTVLRLGLESALLTPGADRQAAIENAVAEVERLNRTVATLFALARDLPAGSDQCDVAVCCREIVDRHRSTVNSGGRTIQLDVEENLPGGRCSSDALREILEVLVDNAERHGRGTITVRVRGVGPGLVIDVQDEGAGIAGDPEAVFERRSATASGHGIGLSLARAVADAHGGRLRLTRPAPNPVFSVMLSSAPVAANAMTNAATADR